MRTKYPSSNCKSTPSDPTTPFQLQIYNLIHQSTASITYLLETTAETPPTPQIWLHLPTFMRMKYPSSDHKSIPSTPTTPFHLQICNLIHQSTASITYLLESTTETPRTPQIWLDWLTFMRTKYPSSDRKSTSSTPTTPCQLQTCNLIHQSTASISYLLESTTETPPTPQISLDLPTFMRTKYPSSDRKSTSSAPTTPHQLQICNLITSFKALITYLKKTAITQTPRFWPLAMSSPNDRPPRDPGDVDMRAVVEAGEGAGQNGAPERQDGSLPHPVRHADTNDGDNDPTTATTTQPRRRQQSSSRLTTVNTPTDGAAGKRPRDSDDYCCSCTRTSTCSRPTTGRQSGCECRDNHRECHNCRCFVKCGNRRCGGSTLPSTRMVRMTDFFPSVLMRGGQQTAPRPAAAAVAAASTRRSPSTDSLTAVCHPVPPSQTTR